MQPLKQTTAYIPVSNDTKYLVKDTDQMDYICNVEKKEDVFVITKDELLKLLYEVYEQGAFNKTNKTFIIDGDTKFLVRNPTKEQLVDQILNTNE